MILCASIVGTFLFPIKKYCNLNDFNKEFVALTSVFNDFFFPPLIRCSLRSRLCLCSAKFLYRMGSAYRLHAGHAIQRKNPQDESQRFSKWRLPTFPQCSAVPPAMLSLTTLCPLSAALAPLRSAVSRLALSRARAHTPARSVPLMHFS